ncbi:hypothetical protein H0H93_010451 [Arthromyces matolae]|nr:hypothetical protein H0H93_010451 [Arthromyces matolae]
MTSEESEALNLRGGSFDGIQSRDWQPVGNQNTPNNRYIPRTEGFSAQGPSRKSKTLSGDREDDDESLANDERTAASGCYVAARH